MRWDSKEPAEIIPYGVDLAPLLETGETLATATAAISVTRGTDAGAAAMLLGTVEIDGTIVRQWVRNGVAGCEYRLAFTVDTSTGMRVVEAGSLACRTE